MKGCNGGMKWNDLDHGLKFGANFCSGMWYGNGTHNIWSQSSVFKIVCTNMFCSEISHHFERLLNLWPAQLQREKSVK